jgi:Flp pilus assembly protein TadG
MRRRLHEALHNTGDRGSVSLWVVIFAFVTLALLILIVDGGQVIVAKSRAADIAEQAARAAADDINPAALRNGDVSIAAGACGVPGPASDLIATYQKGVGVTATMLKCLRRHWSPGRPVRDRAGAGVDEAVHPGQPVQHHQRAGVGNGLPGLRHR